MTEKTGETPLNGAFFLQSFFFAPVVPKKKRQCLSVDIISVSETAFSEPPLSQNLLNVDTNRDGMEFYTVGTGVLCQEQDCKQLCKRIVYTLYVQFLCFWKPNGA